MPERDNIPSSPAERGPALPVFQFSPVNLPRGYQPEGNAPTVAKEAFICQ